jgi:hypothetical protein
MRRSSSLAVAAILICQAPASGSDTLEPAGAMAERHERAGSLKAVFENDVLVRVIEERSNSPQSATGIDKVGNTYRIFSIDVASQGWTATEDSKPVATRCELEVTPELAQAIMGLWTAMLLATHGQLDTADIDGTSYYFSQTIDGQSRFGLTNEPLPSSMPGQMVSIVRAMRDACRTKGAAGLARIPGLVASLHSGLEPQP